MSDNNYLLFVLAVAYCTISIVMFSERLIYFIRCTTDSDFRKKQPILWRNATIQDMILTIAFIWLPILIVKTIVDGLKN